MSVEVQQCHWVMEQVQQDRVPAPEEVLVAEQGEDEWAATGPVRVRAACAYAPSAARRPHTRQAFRATRYTARAVAPR